MILMLKIICLLCVGTPDWEVAIQLDGYEGLRGACQGPATTTHTGKTAQVSKSIRYIVVKVWQK